MRENLLTSFNLERSENLHFQSGRNFCYPHVADPRLRRSPARVRSVPGNLRPAVGGKRRRHSRSSFARRQHRYQARRAATTRQPVRHRYAPPPHLAPVRDLCFIAAFSRYTAPLGAELLMNSAAKARPISSCSIVPNGPGMRRPNQAA
jgi:hypothetical protein